MQDIASGLYYLANSWWNDKISDAVDALQLRFSSFSLTDLVQLMEHLSTHAILPIAGMLATVFLIVRFCSLALDSRGQLDVWGIAKLFIRAFLCMALVQNTYNLIYELVTASTKVISKVLYWANYFDSIDGASVASVLQIPTVSGSNCGYIEPEVFDEIGSLWSFVLVIFMIIYVVVAVLFSYVIYFMGLFRIFKILVYGTFASAAIVTCIGGPEVSRVGFTYIKYMIGLIFSNVVAYVSMMFAGIVRDNFLPVVTVSVTSDGTSASYALAVLGACIGTIAFMAFCCVTVAGVDRTMQRTFAL